MILDDIIDRAELLERENSALRSVNRDLKKQVLKLRKGLDSALNIIEPEQLHIIRSDISKINQ